VFKHSTYPRDVSGASYAIAFHAGARLIDMEFVQFEPLVIHEPKTLRGFVIPTTLLGDGATLRDSNGRRFLLEVRPQGEPGIGKETLILAMADMARQSRAEASGAVWLDARSVPRETLERYPWLYPYLAKRGIDLARNQLAVLPAAHTSLGGIAIDLHRESSVRGLFAVGEAAGGVHGAGRLAGGSGTDVIVSGSRGGQAAAGVAHSDAIERLAHEAFSELFNAETVCVSPTHRQRQFHSEVRSLTSQVAGIWRNGRDLNNALGRLHEIYEQSGPRKRTAAADFSVTLDDAILVARLILDSALARRESRGAHQRTDFPDTDPCAASSTIERTGTEFAAFTRGQIPITM